MWKKTPALGLSTRWTNWPLVRIMNHKTQTAILNFVNLDFKSPSTWLRILQDKIPDYINTSMRTESCFEPCSISETVRLGAISFLYFFENNKFQIKQIKLCYRTWEFENWNRPPLVSLSILHDLNRLDLVKLFSSAFLRIWLQFFFSLNHN